MKVVILAAGMGKRFKRLNLPKPLTILKNGQSILDLQLSYLSRVTSLHNVIVVVGYRKEKVIEQYPDLSYVFNPDYSIENTSKSLLRAVNKIDDDLLWLNGDVVFHPEVLEILLSKPEQSRMVVNVGPVGDEEVKYRATSQGKILEVSKEVKLAQGEALGINYFTKTDLPQLRQYLKACQNQDYFEKAIEMFITHGGNVWTAPIEASQCTEIDFPEDLDKANLLLEDF